MDACEVYESQKVPVKVCIVTGLSGAGKSTALRAFEDLNYFVVDGLPAGLAPEMAEMMKKPSMRHFNGIALGMDMRQSDFISEYTRALRSFKAQGIIPALLFLEADNNALMQRFATTRRPHPMEKGGLALEGAVLAERKHLAPLRQMAEKIIDSSNFSIHDLRREIQRRWGKGGSCTHSTRVNVISFGFKHGVPKDADMIFDLRFLPNPYFFEELKPLSGMDKAVYDFVLSCPETVEFKQKLFDLVFCSLRQMEKEGRYRTTIAMGCTGGRHRSVAIAQDLGHALSQADYQVSVEHRHIECDNNAHRESTYGQ